MRGNAIDKTELFSRTPVGKALFVMAVPTIISQLVNLIYNVVDTFFIGRTGNSYMVAATTIALNLYLICVALANLFGIGGGSQVSRLMGAKRDEEAKRVSAFCILGAVFISVTYSLLMFIFMDPVLTFLGASENTLAFCRSYTIFVIIIGGLPCILSLTLAHMLRNTGYSAEASIGLSGGGILNVILDPLFMFVIFPKGMEITGAAVATCLSNVISMTYLLFAYRKASKNAPLSLDVTLAGKTEKESVRAVFGVGIPSALLTGLFDVGNMFLTILAAAHNDMVLAAMGIVLKVERIPNAVNVGICQGMLPVVAYNYSAKNHDRMKEMIKKARNTGLTVSVFSIIFFQLFAGTVTKIFLDTGYDAKTALLTLGFAALFLRIRSFSSPVQLLNYHASFCMQAMGNGRDTMLHAFVREIVFYIPFMYVLDRMFAEKGLAAALPIAESCGAAFAIFLLNRSVRKHRMETENQ